MEYIKMTMMVWEVYEDNAYYDTVYFDDKCDKEYVREQLIEHDGYPDNITLSLIGVEGEV